MMWLCHFSTVADTIPSTPGFGVYKYDAREYVRLRQRPNRAVETLRSPLAGRDVRRGIPTIGLDALVLRLYESLLPEMITDGRRWERS